MKQLLFLYKQIPITLKMQRIDQEEFQDNKGTFGSVRRIYKSAMRRVDKKITFKNVVILLIFISCIAIIQYISTPARTVITQRSDSYITDEQAFSYNMSVLANSPVFSKQRDNDLQQTISPKRWQIQKKVWIYRSQSQQLFPEHKSFQIANLLNTKQFTQLDDYKYIQVNQNNYTNFLSLQSQQKIKSTIDTIEKRLSTENDESVKKQINQNKQDIRKRLVVYFLLLQNGGIFVDNNVTVVQKFSTWLEDIMSLPYINIGDKINSKIQPKCFGFFRREYGSIKQKLNVKRKYQFEKKMIMFPSLEDWFLACEKNSEFLRKLIDSYLQILVHKQNSFKLSKLNKNEMLLGMTNPKRIYEHGHLLAAHAVLQQRQHQLNHQSSDQQYTRLAIDDFGLVTINSFIGPRRMQHHYPTWNSKKCFIWMCKLTVGQFELSIGKFRFVVQIQKWITQMIGKQLIQPKKFQQYVVQNSFFHTFFIKPLPSTDQQLKTVSQQLIQRHQIEPFEINEAQNINNPQWTAFPKHLWIVWDSGMRRNSSFIVEACSENLKRSAQNSGLQLHIVTQSNIKKYLSQQTLDKIDFALKHATWNVTRQAISDIWRLALLMEHGGIYVDSTTFTINENFDWVKNVTRMPNHLIWNRYGKQPNVLMFWNLQYSNDMVLKIDRKYNTKQVWQLSYESNFITAVKGSELIKDWFHTFLQWIMTEYWIAEEQMRAVNTHYERWTRWDYKYLLVMDAIKYVVGKKQKQIDEGKIPGFYSVSDYYKVWSYPGQMAGQVKFRSESSFQDTDYRYHPPYENSVYRFEFPMSYVQSIDGLIVFQAKFFSQGLGINKMLLNFYEQRKQNFNIKMLYQIVHPQSLVGKLLFYRYPNRTLYYLSYYTNQVCGRLEFKGNNQLGF